MVYRAVGITHTRLYAQSEVCVDNRKEVNFLTAYTHFWFKLW